MSFAFNTIQTEPIAIISLYGELIDRTEAQQLLNQLNLLSEGGIKNFILELSELKYMNSTGLNVLINVLTKARKNGGELVICGISKKVNELLLITKLNSVFTVSESTDEAILKFNS
ncbi:MAG: anti-sigma factor antagonist [Bacteroidetes bacterium]|nr:anti-sigma factor antagonist [Bacteroidota bacterium]PHX82601.1 MAG: anti-anti-sigma factor [Flavobacteriales bacterium]